MSMAVQISITLDLYLSRGQDFFSLKPEYNASLPLKFGQPSFKIGTKGPSSA